LASPVSAKILRYGVGADRVLASNLRPLQAPLKLTFALTYWLARTSVTD
jgi:hypothetical protein